MKSDMGAGSHWEAGCPDISHWHLTSRLTDRFECQTSTRRIVTYGRLNCSPRPSASSVRVFNLFNIRAHLGKCCAHSQALGSLGLAVLRILILSSRVAFKFDLIPLCSHPVRGTFGYSPDWINYCFVIFDPANSAMTEFQKHWQAA